MATHEKEIPECCDKTSITDSTSYTGITIREDELSNDDSTSIRPSSKSTPLSRSRFRLAAIMLALFASLFVAALDETIVATAVPTITSSLHSSSGYTWIGSAYLLAQACAGPIWAKVSDIWGRKPVLLAAVLLFFCSSLMCSLAPTMEVLLTGRALQGVAGGGLVQLVNITISDLFSVRHRSLFFALLEVMWALAGGLGPIFGGLFCELATWRWCFWINLPISGITFLLLLVFLDVHNPRTGFLEGVKAVDWFGIISILGLTLMLLLGLQFGGTTYAWDSSQVICLLVFGTLMIIPFVYNEKRLAKYPLMPLHILRNPSNVACLLVCFFHGMVMIAGLYYLPLYFQSVKLATPFISGLLILPITLTSAFTGFVSGIFIHHTGHYLPSTYMGVFFLVVGSALYTTLSVQTPVPTILLFQILTGIGAGALFAPPMIALQAGVKKQSDIATATSMVGFFRNLSAAGSILVGGTVFRNRMDGMVEGLVAGGLAPSIGHALDGGDAAARVELIKKITDAVQRQKVQSAFAQSLRSIWIVYAGLAGVVVVSSFFIKGQKLANEHEETKTGLKEVNGNVEKGSDL